MRIVNLTKAVVTECRWNPEVSLLVGYPRKGCIIASVEVANVEEKDTLFEIVTGDLSGIFLRVPTDQLTIQEFDNELRGVYIAKEDIIEDPVSHY